MIEANKTATRAALFGQAACEQLPATTPGAAGHGNSKVRELDPLQPAKYLLADLAHARRYDDAELSALRRRLAIWNSTKQVYRYRRLLHRLVAKKNAGAKP